MDGAIHEVKPLIIKAPPLNIADFNTWAFGGIQNTENFLIPHLFS
jgi:hypothetical protein